MTYGRHSAYRPRHRRRPGDAPPAAHVCGGWTVLPTTGGRTLYCACLKTWTVPKERLDA